MRRIQTWYLSQKNPQPQFLGKKLHRKSIICDICNKKIFRLHKISCRFLKKAHCQVKDVRDKYQLWGIITARMVTVTILVWSEMRRVVAINNQQEIGWFFGFTPRLWLCAAVHGTLAPVFAPNSDWAEKLDENHWKITRPRNFTITRWEQPLPSKTNTIHGDTREF